MCCWLDVIGNKPTWFAGKTPSAISSKGSWNGLLWNLAPSRHLFSLKWNISAPEICLRKNHQRIGSPWSHTFLPSLFTCLLLDLVCLSCVRLLGPLPAVSFQWGPSICPPCSALIAGPLNTSNCSTFDMMSEQLAQINPAQDVVMLILSL